MAPPNIPNPPAPPGTPPPSRSQGPVAPTAPPAGRGTHTRQTLPPAKLPHAANRLPVGPTRNPPCFAPKSPFSVTTAPLLWPSREGSAARGGHWYTTLLFVQPIAGDRSRL